MTSPARWNVEVHAWRGSIRESRHRVLLALADADGGLRASGGDPATVTTFRSAAKPFQLLPFVERGHARRWALGDEELAAMAASHTGSRRHVALVRGLLERFGVSEGQLACGYHEPFDAQSLADVRRDPGLASPVFNNCSGKHAGMLALCRAEGWPLEGYELADHPLQRLMRQTVGEVCGLAAEAVALAVDGCSVSVFGLPLVAMATGYARLASARADGSPREQALARIRTAMGGHPFAVGGHDRFDTELMTATGGRMIAKVGAEGLECVAIVERGLGLAVKCEDGSARAAGPATLAVLDRLGLLAVSERERLAAAHRPTVASVRGRVVGTIEAVIDVLEPVA